MGYIEDKLAAIEKEAQEKLTQNKDEGHKELMADIFALYQEAKALEFHDYLNKRYPAPKQKLVEILQTMQNKAINGQYDN